MANRIKGITVEIGGDTTKLSKALEGVNKNIKNTQTQLKDVQKLLKLDPKNTELIAQKQKLLADAVTATKEKLETLKTAAAQSRSPRIMLLVETLRVPYSNIWYCCSWIPMASATSDCVSPRSFLRFFRIIASRPIFLAIAINLLLNVFVPDIIPAPECKVYSPDRTRYYCTPCALYSKTIKEILWRLGLI